jgi:hypothetical protein
MGTTSCSEELDMELVVQPEVGKEVEISFILLDWSCRESLHILDYLNKQTIPRDQYEIIWIEYYQRRSLDLQRRLETARSRGLPLPVDSYAILDMPARVYYHKHLMYNVGLLLAQGRIVCICDSDAMARPTLVESILREFRADPGIVLHLDQVRNNNRSYHPFNHPSFDELSGPGCANWLNGRPLGLSDRIDPLHTRNYGACMCALRGDLLAIGGADMHRDYLGHMCGPYEMTFRLVNAGKREVWHPSEWLYHVWHPGQAGDQNHAGPHDGKHMSTTALEARQSGRIEPLVPHPAVAKWADQEFAENQNEILQDLICPQWLEEWNRDRLGSTRRAYQLGGSAIALFESEPNQAVVGDAVATDAAPRLSKLSRVRLLPLLLGLLWRQLRVKRGVVRLGLRPAPASPTRDRLRKLRAFWEFGARMLRYNRHLFRVCWMHLVHLITLGESEAVLYGNGEAVRILCALARFTPLRIRAICPFDGTLDVVEKKPPTWSETSLAAYEGPVLVAAFVNAAEHVRRLSQLGIPRERCLVLE